MQSFNEIYKNARYYSIKCNFNMFPSDLMQLYHWFTCSWDEHLVNPV